jgi:integrase
MKFVKRVTAKGRDYWFFRSPQTGLVRLKGLPGSPEFFTCYGEALALRERIRAGTTSPAQDSFAWLVDSYLKSAEYRALADSTQLDYARTCDLIRAELGDVPFRLTTRAMVKAVRDDYADTARKANKVATMLSALYGWAQQGQMVPDGFNPAAGLKKVKPKGGAKEYVPWSDHEIDWAIADAPQHLMTPILLALYCGPRRRDVRVMPWNQWQGDLVRVRTSKTNQLIDMPCHPALRRHLEQLPKLRGVIPHPAAPICLNADGQPWPTDNAMSGALRRFVEGHPRIPNNRSFHGLRYAAASRMEEGGATVGAIEAVLGHRTFRMALKYASARLRAAQGIAAMKGSDNG